MNRQKRKRRKKFRNQDIKIEEIIQNGKTVSKAQSISLAFSPNEEINSIQKLGNNLLIAYIKDLILGRVLKVED